MSKGFSQRMILYQKFSYFQQLISAILAVLVRKMSAHASMSAACRTYRAKKDVLIFLKTSFLSFILLNRNKLSHHIAACSGKCHFVPDNTAGIPLSPFNKNGHTGFQGRHNLLVRACAHRILTSAALITPSLPSMPSIG